MSKTDLVLLHAPSVYDFRQKAILYGPVSDLIPSSPVFEMYPLGFLTITNYLEERGFRVRIVNLALRMINDRRFDVCRFVKRLRPKAFGIDLHWLPHAHGAIEIAKIVKSLHPDIPVIFGGLSASYFHNELIRYPQVDFVLRGDATEPLLCHLLTNLSDQRKLAAIPNLTWKTVDGEVRVNPLEFVPANIDYSDIAPQRIVRMVLRHRDLQSVLPFNGWWQNPITAVFTVKGCAHQCITCGGSSQANALLNQRQVPALRSPHSLVKNILDISRISNGPIFLVGDLYQGGTDYAETTLELLSKEKLKNEIVFEIFGMPPLDYLHKIDRSVHNWSLELSPESHDEKIRQRQDRHVSYSNSQMEEVIATALTLSCHRVDLFFMIGLPLQTRESVRQTISYCQHLFRTSDSRLSCFISPMGPFLDPGSFCFEDASLCGYRLRATTLEEHRNLLIQPSWKQILNYETAWMNRDDLVAATYEAAETLNNLKLEYGRISRIRGEQVAGRIARAKALEARLSSHDHTTLDLESFKALEGEINEFSVSTVCDKQELYWRRHLLNFKWPAILNICLRDLFSRHRPAKRSALPAAPPWEHPESISKVQIH
ncbi:MAG: TIGR04190 family B12-binding domain/radical SAM domain protein [Desulfuromonas sp.]|nr:MAG: TIGR04190 family B12-binding domain/radical SAM domain protein [Desulfuromonas sp.]